MSEFESRVGDHRVWNAMKDLGPVIDRAVALDDLDESARSSLQRLRVVLALCGKRLGATDPLTITVAPIEAMAHAFANQQSQVEAFIGDKNAAHLQDANANADAALVQLAQIPSVQTSEELIQLINVLSSYRSELDIAAGKWAESVRLGKDDVVKLTANLETFKTQTATSVSELKALIDTERQRISTQAAEQQKAFGEAQEARTNTYTETLRKTQEALNKTLTDQQGQFSTAQESRGVQFTTVQADIQKKFNDLMTDYTKRFADQDAGFTKQRDTFSLEVQKHITDLDSKFRGDADKVLADVNARRVEVEKLVGVIGSLGVTSGYQKTANNARWSMWIWQTVTVVAMVVVILFAWKAFLPAVQGDFKWSSFAGRIVLTITVGVLAAYAGAQADRFFHLERQNRKLALELAAIDPFIALLPVEEQQKFKLEIGRRSFAQDEAGAPTPASKSPVTTLDVVFGSKEGQQSLQQVLQTLQKLSEIFSKSSKAVEQ